MWNTFNTFAQKAAEKAKAVAADLEGQLDKSVGIDGGNKTNVSTTGTIPSIEPVTSDDFALDDDDEDIGGEHTWTEDFSSMDKNKIELNNNNNNNTASGGGGPSSTSEPETSGATSASVTVPKDNKDFYGDGVSETPPPNVTSPPPPPTTSTQGQDGEHPIAPSLAESVEATNYVDLPQREVTLELDNTWIDERAAATPETTFADQPFQSSFGAVVDVPDTCEPESALVFLPSESHDSTASFSQVEDDVTIGIIQEKMIHIDEQRLSRHSEDPPQPEASAKDVVVIPTTFKNFKTTTTASSSNYDDAMVLQLQSQMAALQNQLAQREEQLIKKNEQMASLQSMFESEKQSLEMRIEQTKEEAKRRLAKAKESVEAAQKRAAAASSSTNESVAQKEEIIAALREEGEKLAQKQSEMERLVRMAKSEARELRDQVDVEHDAKLAALDKLAKLESDFKQTKADLAAARKGESQASKLELDLQSSREETERKAAAILALEQQIKELKSTSRELQKELEAARKGAVIESEREQKKLMKEYNTAMEDLEIKLRTTEKEAAVREDALRHEVTELRKRWQDAVRRADSLSMDVQSSTAPLLRQLESMERQNRARAAGWTTLETKLRQELEEAVVTTEQLLRERNELKTKYQRLERQHTEMETEFKTLQIHDEEKTKQVQSLGKKMAELESAYAERQLEWDEIQRMANEGVAKVRSEMTQTVVEAEERHVSQLDALKNEVKQERDKRLQLENQVQVLLDKATSMSAPGDNGKSSSIMALPKKAPPKKLTSGQGQAEILAGMSLGGDDSDGERDDTSDRNSDDDDDDLLQKTNGSGGGSSFAVLEGLQSRLKVAKVELNTLRKSLAESEKTREQLVTELAESRNAREKLPLFETKVRELSMENEQMKLEIQGLQEDITDIRELYRNQLNVLIEEKANSSIVMDGGEMMNGGSNDLEAPLQQQERLPEDTT